MKTSPSLRNLDTGNHSLDGDTTRRLVVSGVNPHRLSPDSEPVSPPTVSTSPDRTIFIVLLVVSVGRLVFGVANHEAFGPTLTIALLVVAWSLWSLARSFSIGASSPNPAKIPSSGT